MSGKGKQQRPQGRREVSTTAAPPIVQAKAPPAPEATTLPFTEPAEPPATEPAPKVESVVQAAPAAKDDAPVVVAPKPCRRGHVRAKVLVHGLQATGYALDGEYRTKWSKDDGGEFPRESVDGIYLEAL